MLSFQAFAAAFPNLQKITSHKTNTELYKAIKDVNIMDGIFRFERLKYIKDPMPPIVESGLTVFQCINSVNHSTNLEYLRYTATCCKTLQELSFIKTLNPTPEFSNIVGFLDQFTNLKKLCIIKLATDNLSKFDSAIQICSALNELKICTHNPHSTNSAQLSLSTTNTLDSTSLVVPRSEVQTLEVGYIIFDDQ